MSTALPSTPVAAPPNWALIRRLFGLAWRYRLHCLQVLGIQARYARAEGRLEDATKLEAALTAMGKVATPMNVEPRPAPNADAAGR